MERIERPLFANVDAIIDKLWIDGRKLVLQQPSNNEMQITSKHICTERNIGRREREIKRRANLHELHTVEIWRVKFSIIQHTNSSSMTARLSVFDRICNAHYSMCCLAFVLRLCIRNWHKIIAKQLIQPSTNTILCRMFSLAWFRKSIWIKFDLKIVCLYYGKLWLRPTVLHFGQKYEQLLQRQRQL